ncbi:MAG: hypothetical protein JSW73_03825 [Candidatus Woesearchaeota archaeon]|nr:MAG: hypothetical protein JSW73_03825 [Candidatus Woesearchaeota archaeon]
MKYILPILLIVLIFISASAEVERTTQDVECLENSDCQKEGYEGRCFDNKCSYASTYSLQRATMTRIRYYSLYLSIIFIIAGLLMYIYLNKKFENWKESKKYTRIGAIIGLIMGSLSIMFIFLAILSPPVFFLLTKYGYIIQLYGNTIVTNGWMIKNMLFRLLQASIWIIYGLFIGSIADYLLKKKGKTVTHIFIIVFIIFTIIFSFIAAGIAMGT